MNNYLPSKKFIVIVSCIALAIVLFFVGRYFIQHRQQGAANLANVKGTSVTLKSLVEKDTDGDTVPDWQEALWGTDPMKKDTNGDGVTDDVYIAQQQKALDEKNGVATGTPAAKLNETETFAQQLFSSVASLKQSGNLTPDTIAGLSDGLSKNVALRKELPDAHTASDLVTTAKTKASITAYYESFKKTTTAEAKIGVGDELSLLGDAIDNNDTAKLAKLKAIADGYTKMANDLLKTKVPEDLAPTDLILINSYIKISAALQNLTQMNDNPLVGMIGLSQYEDESAKVIAALQTLDAYLQNNGIIAR